MNRSRMAIFAALAAGSLLGTLVAVTPAGALSCNNCVDATDLVNDSIYNRHLTNGSVRSAEIVDDQVYGVDLANGAVGALDLSPNAKAAIGIVQLSNVAGIAIGATGLLDSLAVTVPPAANGYLLVRVEGSAYINLNAAGAPAETDSAKIGLCTVSGSMSSADCGNAISHIWTQDADNADNLNETIAFSLARVFPASPGTHTFYLNGTGGSAGALYLFGGIPQQGATATVQFFPSQFTVTS
ncbi:MAG: hypothetical protein ACRDJM_06455 [Actinomycetota bacterium]